LIGTGTYRAHHFHPVARQISAFVPPDSATATRIDSMKAKKEKKAKGKVIPVKVVNESLHVGVTAMPYLVSVFEGKEVSPGGQAIGPLGGLDLTGYSEYRLTLHLAGAPGSPFEITELFGPAGSIDQMGFQVGSGEIGQTGVLNYRACFEIFGPKNLFIQVRNGGHEPMQLNGTLYALR
jgi:hypothetical protein